MKIQLKYIFSIVIMLISIPSLGQQTIIVGYGETFESIANKYEITISDLRAANPGKDVCYAGMEIIVPKPSYSPLGYTDITSPVLLRADSILLKAKSLSLLDNYKKAIKLYNHVIDMNVRTPYAYAGRGACYFGMKKYKKAKKDLLNAISFGQLAKVEKEWCEDALEDVEKAIEAKRERRNAVWSKIGLTFAAAAAVTATAYVASEQAKMQNQNYQNYQNSMTYSGGEGSDHLRNADRISAQFTASNNQMLSQGTAQLNQMTQTMAIQGPQQIRENVKQDLENQIKFRKEFEERVNMEVSMVMNAQFKWEEEFEKTNGHKPTEGEIDQWYAINHPNFYESRIQSRTNMFDSPQTVEDKIDIEYKNTPNIDYLQQYQRCEKLAEMWYNNLTTGGVRYKDQNGNIKGVTDSDMAHIGGVYVGNKMGLSRAQKQMKRIRDEAKKHGIIIPVSKWETATAGF